MTEIRKAASLQEIAEELASGSASPQLQKDAAFVLPYLWRRRLPPGVSVNARGRPWRWYAPERFQRPGRVWPDEEIAAALSKGSTCADMQRLTAHRIVEAIDLFRLHEPPNERRALTEATWGAFHSILVVAGEHHEQGARDPIAAAMRDCAALAGVSVDTIKRAYRKGFEDNREIVAPFAASVDASIKDGQSLDDAVMAAGAGALDSWTLFERKALYRHAKKI